MAPICFPTIQLVILVLNFKFPDKVTPGTSLTQNKCTHKIGRITKGHYFIKLGPVAPNFFVLHLQCVKVQVLHEFYQNQTKSIEVFFIKKKHISIARITKENNT